MKINQVFLFLGFSLLSTFCWGQPYILEEALPLVNTSFEDRIVFNGDLYFVNGNGELWIIDGISKESSKLSDDIYPLFFTIYKNKLYFNASTNNSGGYELWVTDGTVAGTKSLININPNGGTSYPYNLIVYNDKLYFVDNDGINGLELWVTDGTVAGTRMFKDINEEGGSIPNELYVYHDKLYFQATNGTNGVELWVTDGTVVGTKMLKDINVGEGSSSPSEFIGYNNKLYFRAFGFRGIELWVTDGTTEGTQLVKDIYTTGNSFPSSFIEYNNKLYFSAYDNIHKRELWTTDGTTEGTVLVRDINTGNAFSGNLSSSPSNFIGYANRLYFSANSYSGGTELWVTDGTSTTRFKDIQVGFNSSYPKNFLEYDGKLYFQADNETNGAELWVTDGTSEETKLVKDINLGTAAANPDYLTILGDRLYFSAQKDNPNTSLWYLTENDVCSNSIPLTVNSQNQCNPQIYNNIDASFSGITPSFICNNSNNKDIWFQVIVPTVGEVTIETSQITDGLTDMVMQVYKGTCGSLTVVDGGCNDDIDVGGGNLHSRVILNSENGIQVGDILYVRIISYTNNDEGEFGICAYASCGCDGMEDNTPPVITGFNPNADWFNQGIFDKDTLRLRYSDYDGVELIRKEDIVSFDNCSEGLTIEFSGPEVVEGEGSIPGDCFLLDKYTWTVSDACNNTSDTSLYVRVQCDFDIKGALESNFIDKNATVITEFTEFEPNSTIFIPCGTTEDQLENLYGYLTPDTTLACNATSPPRAKRTKKRRLVQDNSCVGEEWVWDIVGGCSNDVDGERLEGSISLYFVFEDCASNYVLNDHPIIPNNYSAEQYIQSAGTIKANEQVIFKATNHILLNPGFNTQTASEFQAIIEPVTCPNENNAFQSFAKIIRMDSTAINTNDKVFLKCYPNPALDMLTIAYQLPEQLATLSIFNYEGKEVMQKIISNNLNYKNQQITLDVSNYPSGFYYITLKGNNTLLNEKMVILR